VYPDNRPGESNLAVRLIFSWYTSEHCLGAARVNEVPTSHALIRFGVFELDPESRELLKQGLKVRLQEQPFQILQILLERPGRVVTREELQRRIWPSDTFVDFDRGLYNAIKKLREALGDSAESPRFIETLSRRGYRFIAAVEGNRDAAAVPNRSLETPVIAAAPGRNLLHRIAAGLIGAILLATLLGGAKLWRRFSGASATPPIRSIAVLPLQNLSGDPNQEYFSDALTDGLITDLAQTGSGRVISRTSSMRYKQTRKSLLEIARELNVEGIVEGTVQRSGNRVRITAQLIETSTDNHLWANTYEGQLGDTLELEKHVAEDIADQVLAHVAARNQSSSSTPSRVVDSRALEEYLQGTYNLNRFSRGSGDEELKLAAEHFQRATEIDQNFALAYVGLANAHRLTIRSSNDDLQITTRATQRALQLDPTLSDAWTELGDLNLSAFSWGEAEADFRRAIALNPNNAWALDELADLFDIVGKPDEGWKEYEIAQEVDPNQDHLSYALFKRREYDQAIQEVLRYLRTDPNSGYLHYDLFESYSAKGLYKEAIEELEQAWKLFGRADLAVRLGNTYAVSGYTATMWEYAKALEHLHTTKQAFMPINIAAAYTATGDRGRAFFWLEKGFQQKGHQSAGVDFEEVSVYPSLFPLHSDPRFRSLLERMGLPTAHIDAPQQSQEKTDKATVNR